MKDLSIFGIPEYYKIKIIKMDVSFNHLSHTTFQESILEIITSIKTNIYYLTR